MKTNITNIVKTNTIKPFVLAMAFAFSASAINALAADNTDVYNNARWQTAEAAEFAALDTSGNGLLLPNEASKGKAFSKKTFAKADADHDGYIDQNEYVYFKTGTWPAVASSNAAAEEANLPDSAQSMSGSDDSAMSEDSAMTAQNQTNDAQAGDMETRSVGKVIDDSVITTKAKAEILRTPDLKTLQISVDTLEGEVTLSGTVDNAAAKMKAEQVVSKVGGVKSVKNNLEVKS